MEIQPKNQKMTKSDLMKKQPSALAGQIKSQGVLLSEGASAKLAGTLLSPCTE